MWYTAGQEQLDSEALHNLWSLSARGWIKQRDWDVCDPWQQKETCI